MRSLFCTSLVLLSGCATKFTPYTPQIPLGQEFALEQGSNARVDGRWIIEFSGVPEDSRCPMNARCIWEGNARIALMVRDLSNPMDMELELNTSERFDKRKALPGAVVELVHLEPSRMAGAPTRDYVATLVVKAEP